MSVPPRSSVVTEGEGEAQAQAPQQAQAPEQAQASEQAQAPEQAEEEPIRGLARSHILFVHLPKCGGTAVDQAIMNFAPLFRGATFRLNAHASLLASEFTKRDYGRLRLMIDRINECDAQNAVS